MTDAPCQTCQADCCQFVPMSLDEVKTLQRVSPKKIIKGKIIKMTESECLVVGKCPWLDKNKCSVYDHRPFICRYVGTKAMPCHKMPGGIDKIKEMADSFKNLMSREHKSTKALG